LDPVEHRVGFGSVGELPPCRGHQLGHELARALSPSR
jgi:hypothetical protein